MSVDIDYQVEGLEVEKYKLIDKLRENIKRRRNDGFEEYLELSSKIRNFERKVCALKNLPYAEPIDLEFMHYYQYYVLSNKHNTYIIYNNHESKEVINTIKFMHVYDMSYGGLNDEVYEAHDLYGSGLDIVGEYIVRNSPWISKLQDQNKIHSNYNQDDWTSLNHYLIRLKEGEFNCIASGFEIDRFDSTFEKIVQKVLND